MNFEIINEINEFCCIIEKFIQIRVNLVSEEFEKRDQLYSIEKLHQLSEIYQNVENLHYKDILKSLFELLGNDEKIKNSITIYYKLKKNRFINLYW